MSTPIWGTVPTNISTLFSTCRELWRRVTVLERFSSLCVSWNEVGMGFVKSFWFWTSVNGLHHINSLSDQLWFLQTVMCQPLSSERSGVTLGKKHNGLAGGEICSNSIYSTVGKAKRSHSSWTKTGNRCICVNPHIYLGIRSQIRWDYPLNLSISLSGGKETNQDSPSNGEWTGKSSSLKSSEL
jgi:hypothetical protein